MWENLSHKHVVLLNNWLMINTAKQVKVSQILYHLLSIALCNPVAIFNPNLSHFVIPLRLAVQFLSHFCNPKPIVLCNPALSYFVIFKPVALFNTSLCNLYILQRCNFRNFRNILLKAATLYRHLAIWQALTNLLNRFTNYFVEK